MNSIIKPQIIVSHLRTLDRSGKTGLSFNQLKVIFALERMVARLEANPILSNHLVFKGGFALIKHLNSPRFTHDLDASYFRYPLEKLTPIIATAITNDLQDGMWYGDIKHEEILLAKDYNGVRFSCAFQIGAPDDESKVKKLSRLHLDIALSDEKSPAPQKTPMFSLLDNVEPISWHVYPLEQIFAEKLETFVKRADKNSRGKDIYDMVSIFERCKNNIDVINKTIARVFDERNTEQPKSFREFAQSLDQTILRSSWVSIIVPDLKPTFEESWLKLVDILDELEE